MPEFKLMNEQQKRIVSSNPELMKSLGGVEVVAIDEQSQSATLAFTCRPAFCHTNASIAQGGFITAWMDSAMAHAVILTTDPPLSVASLDISVRFLEKVGPGRVIARGWVVRRGRKIASLAADLHDERGKLLASATSSGMLVPLEPG
ncbi:MAG: PaaI family thioesterase [Burkholderiaceae bacterium]